MCLESATIRKRASHGISDPRLKCIVIALLIPDTEGKLSGEGIKIMAT